jgi:phthalate 4,5-dioxygenase oxygenase subunit
MLSPADNELITRTGADTPGGAFLRDYWFPVLLSSDLEAGGAPRQVRLFGEDLVAFRAHDGRVGLLDEACPHRRASLALARNDDCALRCLFHGWKIGVDGAVLEAPSEPAGAGFAARVKVRKYHVREAGSIVWAFTGAGEPTPFPSYAFTGLPDEQVRVTRALVRCNWVQIVEGFLDSSHISHLHASAPSEPAYYALKMADGAPTFDVELTPYGLHAAAIRNVGEGKRYTRVTEFVMPAAGFIPAPLAPGASYDGYPTTLIMATPIDDVNTLQWFIRFSKTSTTVESLFGGGWVERSERATLWDQDRAKLASGHATGLASLAMEDIAMAESQGAIADRSRETLGSSDSVITRFRRLLVESIRLHAGGGTPASLSPEISYAERQAHAVIHSENVDWRSAIALQPR